MKAGPVAVAASTVLASIATVCVLNPFTILTHTWWFALIVSVLGAYSLVSAFGKVGSRPAALAALGGVLLAACVAYAAFAVGRPQRIPAAPGQVYREPHSLAVAVKFPSVPDVPTGSRQVVQWPDTVEVGDGSGTRLLRTGDMARVGVFVFRVTLGPIAFVDARSPRGGPVTVTQPDGPAFLSPFLTFPALDGERPTDFFAAPALHRNVQIDYWPGLPSHGVNVPFLVLRISEENGGTLFDGVAVSGRPLRRAGIDLTFRLGTYPVVMESSAPPLIPYWAGIAMIAAGWIGFARGGFGAAEETKS